MYCNIEKCKVMSLGNATSINGYFMVRNNVNLPITRIYEERDLGVLFTSNLKFGSHISQIVHKANRLIGLIIDEPLAAWIHQCCVCCMLVWYAHIWIMLV